MLSSNIPGRQQNMANFSGMAPSVSSSTNSESVSFSEENKGFSVQQ